MSIDVAPFYLEISGLTKTQQNCRIQYVRLGFQTQLQLSLHEKVNYVILLFIIFFTSSTKVCVEYKGILSQFFFMGGGRGHCQSLPLSFKHIKTSLRNRCSMGHICLKMAKTTKSEDWFKMVITPSMLVQLRSGLLQAS